jgi:hypothetical protein
MTGHATAAGSRRGRILYLSHVDWDWAKQRPQFLAEALLECEEVLALYPYSWRRRALARTPSPVPRQALLQLPLRRRSRVVGHASEALQRVLVARACERFRPDVVWVTHPRLAAWLPPHVGGRHLVYDCMDDALGFTDPEARDALAGRERAILRQASLVLVSSESLATKLRERGADPGQLLLVRNAFGGEPLPDPLPLPGRPPGTPFRLGYVGTISAWVDFESLEAALDALPDLEVHLVGPCDVAPPRRERLHVHRPVRHDRLPAFAASMHALAVPFRRTPLIESVDPVKVYEYVNWGRSVVCRRWPGVERLAPFVRFYDTPGELVTTLRELLHDPSPRYGAAERAAFLAANGWAARAVQVHAALERLLAPAEERRLP